MSYSLKEDGFEIATSVLTRIEVENLRHALRAMKIAPGHRNLMRDVPEVAALAGSAKILGLIEEKLGTNLFPVRSIFFDKTPGANWLVPWHQDLTIAVSARRDLPGYGPWSTKEGVAHVQPPLKILESMVAIRLHLDDCDQTNGALRVIPGSHLSGRLNAGRIAELRSQNNDVTCEVLCGGAILMRPLLLHASSEALLLSHRRVIHLEYASGQPGSGLEWAEVVESTS